MENCLLHSRSTKPCGNGLILWLHIHLVQHHSGALTLYQQMNHDLLVTLNFLMMTYYFLTLDVFVQDLCVITCCLLRQRRLLILCQIRRVYLDPVIFMLLFSLFACWVIFHAFVVICWLFFFKQFFLELYESVKRVGSITSNILIQTVCEGYQQMTKVVASK